MAGVSPFTRYCLYLVTLTVVSFSTVHSQDDTFEARIQRLDIDRQIDSYACIARGFCKVESAKQALINEFSLNETEAEEITNFTHGSSNIHWHTCSCSSVCSLTNDCCPDAEQSSQNFPKSVTQKEVKCEFYEYDTVPVVSSCPTDSDSSVPQTVKDLCEKGAPDGKTLAKVSSSKSFVTYANVYCAMCHGEIIAKLMSWNIKFTCSLSATNINLPKVTTTSSILHNGTQRLEDLANKSYCAVRGSKESPPEKIAKKLSSAYGALASKSIEANDICKVRNDIIDECPPGSAPLDISQCQNGKASYVTLESSPHVIYRNPACAKCNSIRRDAMQCQVCSSGVCLDATHRDQGLFRGFSVLVQPYPDDGDEVCRAIDTENNDDDKQCTGGFTSIPRCNYAEYLDTNTLTCVPICPANLVLLKGICIEREQMSTSICDKSVTYNTYRDVGHKYNITGSKSRNNAFYMDMNNGSVICHSCTRAVLIDNKDLKTFKNGSVKFNGTVVDRLFLSRENNSTFLCFPRTVLPDGVEAKVMKIQEYQDWLTMVLCLISICFLILFFVAFCFIKRMRNIPGSTIAGNMLMFLLAYVTFLSRELNDLYPNPVFCEVIAVLVNYFFIAAFVFMILYAILIIRSLEFIDLDSRYTSATVAQIWLTGLLLPFVIIAPALLLDEYVPDSVWSPGYGGKNCFMSHREGNIVFFTVPIAVCLLISIAIYVIVVQRLRKIAAATSRVRESHKEKVFLCLKLIVVLGFNWLTAVIAAAVDRNAYPVANEIVTTIFIICCCLHGFFGFVVFVASGSNVQLMKAKYHQLTSGDSNQTSSSSGGRAIRTYSGPNNTSMAVSEMSTMIKKSPKSTPTGSPIVTAKFSDSPSMEQKGYSSLDNRLSPTMDSGVGEEKQNGSPISTRSTSSRQKCDFF